jgi:hypothetical protein
MNLGRIRVEPVSWQNEDQYSAFKPPFSARLDVNNFWKTEDPFVFMPLLPLFIYQVPKVGEYVHVIYYNTELQDRNKFYIQGTFSSPNNTKFEPYDSSLAFTAKGERNTLPNDIRTNNGEYQSLWAGQDYSRTRKLNARSLILALKEELLIALD